MISELTKRLEEVPFDQTSYKLAKRELMRKRGFKENQLPYPEVAIEANQPLILPLIDSIVRVCVADVAAVAEVSGATANALITQSLARIHFAK